jgi:hypothetical protein
MFSRRQSAGIRPRRGEVAPSPAVDFETPGANDWVLVIQARAATGP